MNQKEITSFTTTFRPKCDQLIGSYDTKGNTNLAVTTLNVTMEQMFSIYHNEDYMKILDDNNWNIDPTFDTKKQCIRFRIKKLCEWNVDDFYQSIDDDTRKIMVGKQHHVNQQLKEREKLSTLMGINKPSKTSKVLDGACAKLAKHMNITIEEARKILA
tara:strand:- start:423 stop:899 length:477 start_codon:yes stop_codon:yes gene_type:complete